MNAFRYFKELGAAADDPPIDVKAETALNCHGGTQQLRHASAVRRGVQVQDTCASKLIGKAAKTTDDVLSDDRQVVVNRGCRNINQLQHRRSPPTFRSTDSTSPLPARCNLRVRRDRFQNTIVATISWKPWYIQCSDLSSNDLLRSVLRRFSRFSRQIIFSQRKRVERDETMYARLIHLSFAEDVTHDRAHELYQDLVKEFRRIDGCCGYAFMLMSDAHRGLTLTFWDDAD